MKRISGIAALTFAACALGAVPAVAQYANEFSPAKLVTQGKTSLDIVGSGLVIVQVQVNADGTHQVIKVIKSTNPGDNDAAMDIAKNSSYRPAHRGTTPVTAFYDFTLKFNGKSVASSQSEGGAGALSPEAQAVANLIRGELQRRKSQGANGAGLLTRRPIAAPDVRHRRLRRRRHHDGGGSVR